MNTKQLFSVAQWLIILPLCAGLLIVLFNTEASAANAERGQYLTNAGGCIACHTADKGPDFGGGRPLVSPFGTFYSPNITSNPKHGIGDWSDKEFLAAFQQGINPDGEHYYPAFPYPAYTGLSDTDLLDIKAYLDSLTALSIPNRDHELVWYASWRMPLMFWKWLYFSDTRFKPAPDKDEQWNRYENIVR